MQVSFSENAEDIVLARLFRSTCGFYVDVGAGDPVLNSVTKLFYDIGWNGINIEPQADLFEKLQRQRPRDRNYNFAIAATPGETAMTVYPSHWGWATIEPSVARKHHENGASGLTQKVEVRPLHALLDDVRPSRIDFLTVDVEGSEEAVLRSAHLERWQPRVLVVEATAPGETTPTFAAWEPILTAHSYTCVLFDGLNRFYAKNCDDEAKCILSIPANVFDDYVPAKWLRYMEPAVQKKLLGNRCL